MFQMQVRFDGTFGFAGGYVDAVDDTIVTGLNRELVEEINLDLNAHRVTQDNHLCSHVCSDKSLVTHFYSLEVTLAQYQEIERRVLTAHEWGREVSVPASDYC
jgi:8-oxo-dGTP pyrophosphatase MutT (NUDIX family)